MKEEGVMRLRLAAGLIVLSLTACGYLIPRTADLKTVHDTYRNELAELAFPEPQTNPAAIGLTEETKASRPFKKTLSAIEDYRNRYPKATTELAHLKVLEGMAYLQSEQFGLARAVAPEVSEARALLETTASAAPRDALFADNYAAMLLGWRTVREPSSEVESQLEQSDILRQQADRMVANLCRAEHNGRLARARGDQGATYLAMVAAVFDVTSDWRPGLACRKQYEAICRTRAPSSCITRLVASGCQDLPEEVRTDASLADTIRRCQRCAPFMESFVSARRVLRANRTIDHFMTEVDRKALDGKANAEASSVRQAHEHLLAALEHQGDNLQDVRAFEQRYAAQSRPLAYYFWTRRLYQERHQTFCTGPHAYPDCPSAADMQVCTQEQ
jgi:hypothetical protein